MLRSTCPHLESDTLRWIQESIRVRKRLYVGTARKSIWWQQAASCRGLLLRDVSCSSAPVTTASTQASVKKLDASRCDFFKESIPGCPEPMGATYSADTVCCCLVLQSAECPPFYGLLSFYPAECCKFCFIFLKCIGCKYLFVHPNRS